MTLGEQRPTQIVNYYPPFTHYEVADLLRVFTATAAVVLAALMLLIAYRRWDEDRRSAALFLAGYAFTLVAESTVAAIVALGHPPVWWVLGARVIAEIVAAVGCRVVIGEARRGAWARRA